MARPAVLGPTRFVSLHCPTGLIKRLDKLAEAHHVTRSTVVRRAIGYYLDEEESWDADDDARSRDA